MLGEVPPALVGVEAEAVAGLKVVAGTDRVAAAAREMPASGWSGQDWLNHFAVDVGQPEVPPLVREGELLVVNPHQVEQGGMKIVDVDYIIHGMIPQFICCAVGDPGLDSPAGHPE